MTLEAVKYCARCRARLHRRRFESTRDFRERRYCSRECAREAMREQFADAKRCQKCGRTFPREPGYSKSRWQSVRNCPGCRVSFKRRPAQVPAEPFQQALRAELAKLSEEHPGQELTTLAARVGRDVEFVRRFLKGYNSHRQSVRTFSRKAVEDTLHLLGIGFWEVYPEIHAAEDIPLEPDTWCPHCEDVVIPVRGECPWCDEILVVLGELEEAA